MKDKVTQGTIISNVRSIKYPTIRCKGIVISARCDFEQNKIKYFHFLSAMNMEEWIYEVLFWIILDEVIKKSRNSFKTIVANKKLNIEILEQFEAEKVEEILHKVFIKQKDFENADKAYKELMYYKSLKEKVELGQKKEIIKKNKNSCLKKITTLSNNGNGKFCFIPEISYCDSASRVRGIVVDLQDIYQIDIELCENIEKSELDYMIMSDKHKIAVLNKNFFMEDKNDFIIAEGIIGSPWMECLMQSFAHTFVRVGVENATESEMSDFYIPFLEGEKI